jgi:hypothetical protein
MSPPTVEERDRNRRRRWILMELLHNDPAIPQHLWELLDLLVRGLEFQESGGWADEERPTPAIGRAARAVRNLTPPPMGKVGLPIEEKTAVRTSTNSFEKAVEILEKKDKK